MHAKPLTTPEIRSVKSAIRAICSQDLPRSHGFEPLRVEGKIPADLRGTLFRNGPGLFGRGDQRYSHLFEADGAVSAVRLTDDGAFGAAKVTETPALAEERAAGRMLYGNAAPFFRRIKNGLGGKIKNTANTSVMHWQGRLFAMMEAAQPFELDPRDLSPIGETDFEGQLAGPFSAHPHRVESLKTTFNFGVRYGAKNYLDIYALPDEGKFRHVTTLPLKNAVMLHDFIATEKHLMFFVGPAEVVVPRAVLGIGDFGDMFKWNAASGTEIIVVPLADPESPTRFFTDAFWQWHFANAFEVGSRIAVDLCAYENFDSFHELGFDNLNATPGHLRRAWIDLSKASLTFEELWTLPTEFPKVHPRLEGAQNRYVWLVTQDDAMAPARFDLETGASVVAPLDSGELSSEGVFVPTGEGEDEGYLVSYVYNEDRHASHLAIFDGRSLESGAVAKLWFDHHIPVTFHGVWVGEGDVRADT